MNNRASIMMDALRVLQSLQMICLYADDVVMRIETAIYSDTKAQSIFVNVRKNDAAHHSTGAYKSFDFYDNESVEEISDKVEQVRTFVNEIIKTIKR